MQDREIATLGEYIHEVENIKNNFYGEPWFRGHSKLEFKLIPSIYREENWKDSKPYDYYTEFESFKYFKRKCKITNRTNSEYLHLMQHHGAPTRLLDWTESSIIALFFALININECNNPVVYVIDPFRLNDFLHKSPDLPYMFGDDVEEIVNKYIQSKTETDFIDKMPEQPIALMPSYLDDRIIAQKSVFVLFGSDKKALEDYRISNFYFLDRIRIKNEAIENIKNSLNLAGVTYSSIYPDLSGLGMETKNKYFKI